MLFQRGMQMEPKTIVTAFGNVAYWVSHRENAPALVMLHGLTADHTLFEPQYQALQDRYTVLVWDAPAHGQSRPYEPFDYRTAAEHLKSMLDAEGITKAVLIGQSMGGFVIQTFLASYPAYGVGFIAIDTCPFGESYYSRSDRWWLKQVEPLARWYPLRVLRWAMVRQCACTPYGRENMRRILARYGKAELCHLMGVGFAGFLSVNQELTIPCPSLLIVGAKDKTGKVRAYNEAWRQKTGFPLEIIPDAAHNANTDQPERVNQLVEQFVMALPSADTLA